MKLSAMAFAAICALAQPAEAQANHWTLVSRSSSGTETFVDLTTVRRFGQTRRVWLLKKYAKENGRIAQEKVLENHDCEAGTIQVIATTAYDKVGTVLQSYSWTANESPKDYVIPGSVGDATSKAICSADGA